MSESIIQGFGFGTASDNDKGVCIGNLEDLALKEIPYIDNEKGLFLKVKVTKHCHCDFNCDITAIKDSEEIPISGISMEFASPSEAEGRTPEAI